MTRHPPRTLGWTAALVLAAVTAGPAPAFIDAFRVHTRDQVEKLNRRLAGRVLDYTNNHGVDRRLYSAALGQKRDLYVYLPPGYDGRTAFPAILVMHGIGQDEESFLDVVEVFDAGIRAGTLPPMIVAVPDGSITGRASPLNTGSFFINSRSGRFEDHVIGEVWPFVTRNYCVRPEREARVISGASMGGMAAYNLGFKHREKFGQIGGLMPALDLRYTDCHGNYHGNYDPTCVGRRTEFPPHHVIGRFYGVIKIREKRLLRPLIDYHREDVLPFLSRENPIEMLVAHDIRPGEFGLFVGYGTEDEFNIDAQVEHFRDVAAARGIAIETVPIPGGGHSTATAYKLVPALSRWLSERLAPYVPPGYTGGGYPVGAGGVPTVVIRRAGIIPRQHVIPLAEPVPVGKLP